MPRMGGFSTAEAEIGSNQTRPLPAVQPDLARWKANQTNGTSCRSGSRMNARTWFDRAWRPDSSGFFHRATRRVSSLPDTDQFQATKPALPTCAESQGSCGNVNATHEPARWLFYPERPEKPRGGMQIETRNRCLGWKRIGIAPATFYGVWHSAASPAKQPAVVAVGARFTRGFRPQELPCPVRSYCPVTVAPVPAP
jgi:hypothetical protein